MLVELEDAEASVTSMLKHPPEIAVNIALSDGTKFDIMQSSQLPLHIEAPIEDWEINVKIADLGMSKLPLRFATYTYRQLC